MNVLPAISNSHHSSLNIADMKVTVKRVTEKTHWIFVQIKTKNGLTGSGEASNCFRTEAPELTRFFELVKGESPFHIKKYRKRGWPLVLGGGLNEGTAFSAIEQPCGI